MIWFAGVIIIALCLVIVRLRVLVHDLWELVDDLEEERE